MVLWFELRDGIIVIIIVIVMHLHDMKIIMIVNMVTWYG